MDIRLTFLGAVRGVTGSRYLIEAGGTKFLVDCGLYQERDFLYRNWEPFRFPPQEISAVLLTHAHLDHCGLLPKLVREGFRGRVICTPPTADITKIILLDAAHVQEEDAAYKKKRHMREGRQGPYPEVPLYTVAEAEASLQYFSPVEYGKPVSLGREITATFYDAGHILGSAMIKIDMGQGDDKCSIVFSGDIGRWDRPLLHDPHVFRDTDYIVMESTYGDRAHEGSEDIGEELARIVNEAFRNKGNIIVPSFALQRAQEILYYLNKLLLEGRIPYLDVYLDSPMAQKITEVFRRYADQFDEEMKDLIRTHRSPFDFPGLRMVETTEESKALNELTGTAMIIAGSGMATGGRIKHHLANNIERPECIVLFIGYQAEGTLGRQILDGARAVRIHGVMHPVRAKVYRIEGFSAHADRDDLIRWLSKLSPAPRLIFITHGELQAAEAFKAFLRERTGFKATIPGYGETFRLK
ncbi:MAG: MBL fold metallo-hydrolase [Dehalococcoidales bacterium]|nr:MBL fold metallo-hydrolase [Dehalococcoidales bacterium]